MIQRVQTLWLLLAAIAGFLTTQLPLYSAGLAGAAGKQYRATESLLLFAVSVVAALFALVAVFLFKNRKTQMSVVSIGIVISIALIALEVWQVEVFQTANPTLEGGYYWGALMPIAMFIFFILAAMNIRKDNKLIKSLDRLR